ncbi:glycosyltransferase family 87 protein [Cupriavidus cauae]|uniref:DUF2029 domain-containing protein n=1 Tax=Cupriavidus cauae TaxID=2608999 RepID=A0A5M8AIE9_9BURK|nr:glycosyltransferase family 87 protein [Cupriavidus cauae]KAA6122552.1 DUF2029 domain-containing protein [Cupriavidus cauae]
MTLERASIANTLPTARGHWLTLERVRLYAGAMLLAQCLILVAWAWITRGFTADTIVRPGADFSVFWSASHLLRGAGALAVYDYAQLQPVIAAHGAVPPDSGFYLPWLYPPTFLWVVLPLSLLPFAWSYVAFIGLSAAGYVAALLRLAALASPPRAARGAIVMALLGFPGLFLAATIGQNALLTAALAAWALVLLPRRPLLAGVLIGLLAIKPQLALMFPVALIAGREWRALGAAAVTAGALAAASVAAFGWQTVPAFVSATAQVTDLLIQEGIRAWYVSPTLVASVRLAGGPPALAYALQAVLTLATAGALACVWRRHRDTGLRTAALALAAMLATPYLWYYELAWLGMAVAGLAGEGVRRGWMPGERLLLAALWCMPMLMFANALAQQWQGGVQLLALGMAAVLRRAWRTDTDTGSKGGGTGHVAT